MPRDVPFGDLAGLNLLPNALHPVKFLDHKFAEGAVVRFHDLIHADVELQRHPGSDAIPVRRILRYVDEMNAVGVQAVGVDPRLE